MTTIQEGFGGIAVETWERLVEAARQVQSRAYVPQSNFPVGAALLTEEGEIVQGCNVENATIGATVCAERTAVGTAVAEGYRDFEALCIITDSDPPAPPCGICRQVLVEFCEELPILVVNPEGSRECMHLSELLPHAFRRGSTEV